MNTQLHLGLFGTLIRSVLFDGLKHCGKLVAEEHRNNCGRRFVCTEAVIVSGGCSRKTEQILIIVNRLYNGTQEKQELGVFIRSLAGSEKVYAGIGGNRPVVVLAAAVYSGKGLFMEQAHKTVFCGDLLHNLHSKLVVVGGNIGSGIDWSKLVLGGSNLVVLGFCENSQLPQLFVKVGHIFCDSRLYNAEIVIVHFLTLWGHCSEKGSAGEDEVLALIKQLSVHKEVFLLGTHRGAHTFDLVVTEQS